MDVKGDAEQELAIDCLQKWFEDNVKLPRKIDRIALTRFYYCMYKNVEKTKKLIETNYTLRQNAPDIFINRDPLDEDTQNTAAYADMIHLPGLTPENCRVTLLHLNSPDPKMMHHAKDIKAYIMVTDHRFSLPDVVIGETQLLSDGEVIILDMDNVTMKHAARLSLSVIRTCAKYLQLAYPVRIKGFHLINCPPYTRKIFAIVKPFINKDVFKMIHFHTDDLKTLYDFVPREMLTEEYGGQAGKRSDYREHLVQSVLEKRDYLMDPNYWKI